MPPASAVGLRFPWLVTDLDGTLVDRGLRLVPRSADALRRYRERGGVVYIATGRNEESAGRYHRDLGLDTPMILYNGARIVDPATGARLLDLRLDGVWPTLRDAVLPRLPAGVGAVGFAGQDAHVLRAAPPLADYARRDRIELRTDEPTVPLTKMMLVAPHPPLDGLAALVTERCPGVRLLQSEDTYLEILPAGAGKGPALRWLAERTGMDLLARRGHRGQSERRGHDDDRRPGRRRGRRASAGTGRRGHRRLGLRRRGGRGSRRTDPRRAESAMILTVLGSSGTVPAPGNPCSGYLVERDGYRLLLDLGTGAFGELSRHRAAEQIDAVVLSHRHVDHMGDLAHLAYAQERSPRRRVPTVVIAPADAVSGMRRTGMFTVRTARDGEYELGPFRLRLARVRHQVETYATRVDAGARVLTYTGDSGPCRELVAIAEGADILLAEAALGAGAPSEPGEPAGWDESWDMPAPHHLSAAQAGELCHRAGAGLLVLTHLRPWHSGEDALAAASARHRRPTVVACPGLRLSAPDQVTGEHR